MPLGVPSGIRVDGARIVFVFFTILYQLKTLLVPSRFEHKSPVNGGVLSGFLLVPQAMEHENALENIGIC